MRRLFLLMLLAMPLAAQQAPVDSATAAIARGEPWRASQLLAPLLDSPATRTPPAVLLAARAAAGWEGWTTVHRLLAGQPWLDSLDDRLGRRLLAQSDLADTLNPQALADARAAVGGDGQQRTRDEHALREVLLARAFDRLDQLDSAATWYRAASQLLPDIGDWLVLRAGAVTTDSSSRAALFSAITLPSAAARIPWADAIALERADSFNAAATRYDRLGARIQATQARWRGAATDSARAQVAAALATLFRNTTIGTTDIRDLLDFTSRSNPPFTLDDRLAVARRAATVGRPQDAVDQFAQAARIAPLSSKDRIAYGTALGALQRWPDAVAQFAGITDPAVAGLAAYYRARGLLRSDQQDAAVAALHAVVKRFPRDTFAAGTALFLLADLAIDAGKIDSARHDYLQIAMRYQSFNQHAHATLLAAVIAFATGHPAITVRELTAALANHAVTGEVDASRYWLARASYATGDTATARSIWRELATKGPDSYYAVRAAARLDTVPWSARDANAPPPPDSLDAAFARAALLDQLGMASEAKLERDRLSADARSAAALERVAQAFDAHGFVARGSQLAARAVATGLDRDLELWRLIYPMPYAGVLRAVAAREQVDPLLVASLIRQESGFDPHATSRTNARGLMQVEPSVGRELARLVSLPDFDPALLWIGPLNLVLGIHHFAAALSRYPELERSLAAYNAGTSRVDRWSQSPLSGHARPADQVRAPLDDVDLFVERIPIVETRDYVRAIIRNREVYRMIYGPS